jgi:hypothetical protein
VSPLRRPFARTSAPAAHRLFSAFRLTLALVVAVLAGCATQPDAPELVGAHHCESFFIYSICIADRNEDGDVDYIYFGDDFQVFMYTSEIEAELRAVEPFHVCAVRMSDDTRELSSQLLYSDGLGLSDRLSVKGRLLANYRSAQPAVEACNAQNGMTNRPVPGIDEEDPFLSDDDWDEDWSEEG